MVTPLKNRTSDEQEPALPLRFDAAWKSTDVSVADARAAVRALLARAGHHPGHSPSQDAQLVVSELVTNALRHAPGPGGLALEVSPETGVLRIAVRDSSPRPPVLPGHDARRVGGHGLHLVIRLCGRLQTFVHGTGKQVVAHCRLHPPGEPEHGSL
ncbi:ATP-binding protein [Streptomyces sp. NPDC093970]|uniref:ATP-binding protein n=1 Tax=Streptomyces sp. NPDC093970 TaxID=3155076 RepID=UPI00341C504B